jgi:hypothetical protein
VVIGGDEDFSGLDVIKRNFDHVTRSDFPIYNTMDETVDAAIRKATGEEEPEEEDCRELVLFLLTDGAYRFVVRRRQIITSKRSTAIWRSPFS